MSTPSGAMSSPHRSFLLMVGADDDTADVLDHQHAEALHSRYELLEPDPRGDFGPRSLAVYEFPEPPREPEMAVAGTRWRVVWRRLDHYPGSIVGAGLPFLFIVGMDVPADTDPAGLRAFNSYYDDPHVPEVVSALRFRHGLRYELWRADAHRPGGCPRFLAAYLGDEEFRAVWTSPGGPPPISNDGPPAWMDRETKWRLHYRRTSD